MSNQLLTSTTINREWERPLEGRFLYSATVGTEPLYLASGHRPEHRSSADWLAIAGSSTALIPTLYISPVLIVIGE